MNCILLKAFEVDENDVAIISDDRFTHVKKILKSCPGDTLTIGIIGGQLGSGKITAMSDSSMTLHCHCTDQPPAKRTLSMVLALPRPIMLKRILKNMAEFGISDIHLIHSSKVEKSYWQSPQLSNAAIELCFIEGLSQAKDCILPTITQYKAFKPFVQDILPTLLIHTQGFVAHPYHSKTPPLASDNSRLITIGPEGGFTEFEIELLKTAGLQAIHLGPRIYRVENAVTILTQQLSLDNLA